MRKLLTVLLTLVFVTCLASAALANRAEQFVDVPAGHWSYAAVTKLAKAGVVDRDYEHVADNKPVSRYEMAVIVAKAIAKEDKADAAGKALIMQLSKEYAGELKALGVQLEKTEAKEKKVGSIAVNADARFAWINYLQAGRHDPTRMRFRLNFRSDVNENTSFYGRLVLNNQAEMGTFYSNTIYSGEDRVHVADVAFTRKNFANTGAQVTYGRFTQQMDTVGGYWMFTNGGVDGVKVLAGNKVKVEAGFANFGPAYAQFSGKYVDDTKNYSGAEIKDAFFTKVSYPVNEKLTVGGWWLKEKTGADSRWDVKSANFSTKLSPKYTLAGDYGQNSVRTNGAKPIFYHYRLTYGGEKYNVPGSWSVAGEYYKFEPGANNVNYTANMIGQVTDVKAWSILARAAVEKNILASMFYSFDVKKVSDNTKYPNYFRLQLDYLW
ncbi:hypothetical protein [Anaerospora hongkongensis]|uniref:hypothetical protein n=1 Tax=Anaerospora hongkongensis TaxID=244830 RepID=UPI00289849C2|nr:hypothetical protein [Anaerospora hongkongensis]